VRNKGNQMATAIAKETSTTTGNIIYQPFAKNGHQKQCRQHERQQISGEDGAQVVEEDTTQVWQVRL